MAKNVIIRNNENTEIICSEVDTIILPTANGGTAIFKDWNGVDQGSNINTFMCCRNILIPFFEPYDVATIKTNVGYPLYKVEAVEGATYSFTENSSGYYQSGNKGVATSYALCKVSFNLYEERKLYVDCISYGESKYDYGILSTLNNTLSLDNTADSTNVQKSFYNLSSSSVQTVEYGIIPIGESFIYIKFRKDGSTNSNNDTLQFKIRLE